MTKFQGFRPNENSIHNVGLLQLQMVIHVFEPPLVRVRCIRVVYRELLVTDKLRRHGLRRRRDS